MELFGAAGTRVHESWRPFFEEVRTQLLPIARCLAKCGEYYPPADEVFAAFQVPYPAVRVVIVGQDPYPRPGVACGLAFSVRPGQELPPTLRVVFDEIKREIPTFRPVSGDLRGWVAQGVLLLNNALTYDPASPRRHRGLWRGFHTILFRYLNRLDPLYLFVGADAKELRAFAPQRLAIDVPHPSPRSNAAFVGCGCFSWVNGHLTKRGTPSIDWTRVGPPPRRLTEAAEETVSTQ